MKPGSIVAGRMLLALLTIGTLFTLISWGHKQSPIGYQKQYFNDTTPKGKKIDREKKIRDLDDVIDELNAVDLQKEMEKVQIEVQKAMKEIDGQKTRMEMEKAMKEVDFEKMQKELKESMGKLDIDMGKMQQEIRESMKELDGEKMKAEMEKAMKEVDMSKLQKEIRESMAAVDWEEMKKEMNEIKKFDMSKMDEEMAKVKQEMEKIGPQIEKEMQHAKIEIEKAKEEMKEYKSFVDGLDKDGLIKKNEEYTIKHKDGELIINGKKVSNETYLKYRSFLEKHPKLEIKKSADDFNIDVD
jgi:chromosome segregation ATPase